jgi:hypothetical protein
MPQKLPYTENQFEMAVACIKHFEGWHNMKDYVGYGHQLQKGERYSARTLIKRQGDLLLRLDLMLTSTYSATMAKMRCYSQYWLTMSAHIESSAHPNGPRAVCCARLSEATGTSTATTSPSAAGMADR